MESFVYKMYYCRIREVNKNKVFQGKHVILKILVYSSKAHAEMALTAVLYAKLDSWKSVEAVPE